MNVIVDSQHYIERAKAYVGHPNAHDLGRIASMFESAATYSSSAVGYFETRASILEMMAGFFTRFPDVSWSVSDYEHAGDASIAFEFLLTAVDQQTGEKIVRHGHERIDFDASGLIRHVEVNSR